MPFLSSLLFSSLHPSQSQSESQSSPVPFTNTPPHSNPTARTVALTHSPHTLPTPYYLHPTTTIPSAITPLSLYISHLSSLISRPITPIEIHTYLHALTPETRRDVTQETCVRGTEWREETGFVGLFTLASTHSQPISFNHEI